jgi:hypothetical protein
MWRRKRHGEPAPYDFTQFTVYNDPLRTKFEADARARIWNGLGCLTCQFSAGCSGLKVIDARVPAIYQLASERKLTGRYHFGLSTYYGDTSNIVYSEGENKGEPVTDQESLEWDVKYTRQAIDGEVKKLQEFVGQPPFCQNCLSEQTLRDFQKIVADGMEPGDSAAG